MRARIGAGRAWPAFGEVPDSANLALNPAHYRRGPRVEVLWGKPAQNRGGAIDRSENQGLLTAKSRFLREQPTAFFATIGRRKIRAAWPDLRTLVYRRLNAVGISFTNCLRIGGRD